MDKRFRVDKERLIDRNKGWKEFKEVLSEKYKDLDMDKILEKQKLKRDPIVSYGVIEFVMLENSVAYHIFRRRNTMEYDIVIRGFAKKNQLFEMLSLLSEDERLRILENEFDDIWDDFWIDHQSNGYYTLRCQAERRFPETKDLMKVIHDNGECNIKKRPFIFPKGKALGNESPSDAALREAREETKNSFESGELYFQSPIMQCYVGSDDNKYVTHYFIWKRKFKYDCATQILGVNDRKGKERLRTETISHELETDHWIEIPIFDNKKEQWEWENSINSYEEFGIYKRHFTAILTIHNHIT